MMNNPLIYEEWLEKHGGKLKNTLWMTVEEQISDFEKFHYGSLQDYIDRLNQQEYQLYLQRVDAEIEGFE